MQGNKRSHGVQKNANISKNCFKDIVVNVLFAV